MKFIKLCEAVKKKVIYRDGKRKVVKRTDKKGYKTVNGKEVRMSAKEQRNRSLAQRKGSRKRKPHIAQAQKKKARTMAKKH